MVQKFAPFFRFTLFLIVSMVFATACVQTERIGSNLKPDPERRKEVGIQAASEYLKVNDTENALRHIEAVLELDDDYAPAHQGLALIYVTEGQLDKAEQSFKRALRLDPSLSKARNNYSSLLFKQERYEEAARMLEYAVKDIGYDNRAKAMENLGVCYIQLKEYDKAIDIFQRALRMNPRMPRSHLELAEIYQKQGEYKTAIRYVQSFQKITKPSPRSLLLGVQIAQKLNDVDAKASYEVALRNLFPESNEYKMYLEAKANDGN